MARVLDVAAYILEQTGSVSTMKLQKLVYYSQAYSLVKQGEPLFSDRIEAWENGPVVPSLFARHRGEFVISKGFFDPAVSTALMPGERHAIDHVLSRLKSWTGAQLSELTHREDPWREARGSLPPTARSDARISLDAMTAYYGACGSDNPVFA